MRTPLAAAALVAGLGVAPTAVAQTAPPAAPAQPAAPKPAAPKPAAPKPVTPKPAAPSPAPTPAAPAASAPTPAPAPAPTPVPAPPDAEPPPATTPPTATSPATTPPAPVPANAASPPSTAHEPLRAPAPTPAPMLAVNVPTEKGKDVVPVKPPAEEPSAWLDGHALGVEGMVRGGSRLGATAAAADSEERAGFGFDLGAWLRLAPEYTFGLALHRASLGSIAYTSGQTTVNARYATTALELGGRAYPLRREGGELFVGLRVGLAWQDADATGLTPSVNLQPARPFSCSDSGGPGFALGAELGGSLRISRAFWLTGTAGADGYHLSGEPLGNCVLGVGSVTTVSLGAGLLYTFDIGRDAKLAGAPTRRAF